MPFILFKNRYLRKIKTKTYNWVLIPDGTVRVIPDLTCSRTWLLDNPLNKNKNINKKI